ncbi:MAG: hypothetical protein JOZ17_15770 [Acetobacteraceae bacterium]|nr:hypothetical protein [Acetobacteraceae bacterium]
MLQQWKQPYDFVGSYFINVGDNANPNLNGTTGTNWTVSKPIYDQLLSMGNEIGSHSYTHLLNPPTVDANGNPVPTHVVNGQTVSTWAENTNDLYVTPPANGSAPNWTFAYEFGTGNSLIQQNLGIPVAGAALPGAPDTVATSDNVEQYYQTSKLPAGLTGYVNGGWTGVGAGAPNAFGYTDPSDTGSVYIAPNVTFNFTEIEYQHKTPAQALSDWESLFNQLSAHSATPVIVWPWHDYGPTNFNDDNPGTPGTAGYDEAMYTNFIAYAYNAGYEFVTTEDLASRIAAEQAATLSETTSGNVITATVTPAANEPDLGAMALNVTNGAAGQVIQNAGSWYAYNSTSVFLPYAGNTFTVTLGTTQDDVTHIDALPMRADLKSVTGDGSNLTFSFTGDGTVDVHIKTPGTNVVSIVPTATGTGAGPVSATLTGDDLKLVFSDGPLAISSTSPEGVPVQHTIAITESPTPATTSGAIIFGVPSPALIVQDTTKNQSVNAIAAAYTGPVSGIQNQYINVTPDNLNITANTNNWFVHSGGGNDAIAVHGGTNVLDGGTGSNFLTGGSGTDTFFVDDRDASADIWSTLNNFHVGDAATLWGVTEQDVNIWQDNQGASGYTGLTLHTKPAGEPWASVTLVGYTSTDLTNGRLSVSFGSVGGSAYMYVHANS